MNRRKGMCVIAGIAAASVLAAETCFGGADAQSRYLGGDGMPYDAFDALPKTTILAGTSRILVGFAPGQIALSRAQIFDWIEKASRAVGAYYGRFPVDSVRLLIVPVEGSGVLGGTTWGYRGAAIRILLGDEADADDLDADWKMTHEMVHLALPDMDQRYNWLSEGFAVYIEPVARVQAGLLKAPDIWRDMVRDMPKGLPRHGDAGLDNTPTWGRIYWGGAMFCLLADVDMRRRTNNRLGLQDAMRGVLAAGGNHEVDWPIRKILATADKTVGLTVLTDMYERMRATPVSPDLATLWRELGVENAPNLRDDAPLAAVRDAITRSRSN